MSPLAAVPQLPGLAQLWAYHPARITSRSVQPSVAVITGGGDIAVEKGMS